MDEKRRRRYLLNKGNKKEHSHLIVVIDRSNYISEELTRYVKRNEDIKNILFQYVCNPNLEILNIYNYDMDLETQINEDRPYYVVAPYNKMTEAYNFAKQKHAGQIRQDGSAYIYHFIKVAELVKKYFSNHSKINEFITAAYLHDIIEDTDTTLNEIKEKFGEYVAYLVNGVTNNNNMKNVMGKTNYLCDKLLNMEEDVLNLKLCDRLANVLDLNTTSSDFAEKYEIETTIILNYLLTNRTITDIQMEIVKKINEQINYLRKQKILTLTKS